ncbi:MAG: hypothetical protein M0P70_14495 [Desulfobulbaceae bacterium]|nr:hypothetical protein [Desulfobulbaceae bacterium]
MAATFEDDFEDDAEVVPKDQLLTSIDQQVPNPLACLTPRIFLPIHPKLLEKAEKLSG